MDTLAQPRAAHAPSALQMEESRSVNGEQIVAKRGDATAAAGAGVSPKNEKSLRGSWVKRMLRKKERKDLAILAN